MAVFPHTYILPVSWTHARIWFYLSPCDGVLHLLRYYSHFTVSRENGCHLHGFLTWLKLLRKSVCFDISIETGRYEMKKSKRAKNSDHLACQAFSLLTLCKYAKFLWFVHTIKGCSEPSRSPTAQFLLAVVKQRVKKVQGCNLAEVPDRYDSIVPTSMLEASTSATNCLFWSAWIKIGAVANKFLKFFKSCFCFRWTGEQAFGGSEASGCNS